MTRPLPWLLWLAAAAGTAATPVPPPTAAPLDPPSAATAAADAAGLAALSLDTLLDMPVTGASRFSQRRSQASSSVTVIGRAEMLALGHRTLADVLGSVRGTVVATDRTYHYLGVRGAFSPGDYNTRVLVLVDGNRINDPLYDQGFLGSEFPLDLAEVERVEFVAGQGSAVYGANALFGVVNVITREAARRGEGHGSLALGNDGERVLRAGLRLPLAGGGLQLSASHLRRRGGEVFDAQQALVDGDGWARGADGEQRRAAALRWDQGGFTASLVHADRTKGMPLVLGLIHGDPTNRYRDSYSLLNLEQRWPLGHESTLTARAFAGHYRFVGDYAIDYPPPTLNRDTSLVRWHGLEGRLTSHALAGHRLVGGVELQRTPLLLQANDDLAPVAMNYLDDRRSAWRMALYGEDQWTLTPQWALHLGLRVDRSNGQDTQLSPRLAAVWQPDSAWSLKALHGRAFRPPNAYEAFYKVDAPGGYDTNPSLRAEQVAGTELVAEWQPASAWRWSGSVYRNRARHLLLQTYVSAVDRWRFDNTGTLNTRGLELEVEHATDGLRWRANYSHSASDASPALYPAHQLKGTAVLPLAADWTLGLELAALSQRGAAPGQAVAHLTLRGPLAGLVAGGTGGAGTGPAGSAGPMLSLGVRNLADRALFDPGSDPVRQPVVPQTGRSWRLTLDWTPSR